MSASNGLQQEWSTLQNNIEGYEHSAQWLKLAALAVVLMPQSLPLQGVLLLILWLQEGIFRTSQARLGERVVLIEQLLAAGETETDKACQLHSQWLAQRPGTIGLLLEYARSALRPTVAFPYPLLLVLTLLLRG